VVRHILADQHCRIEWRRGAVARLPGDLVIPAFAARAALQPQPATPPALAERPTMN
jgi:hypothetical protein